MIIKYKDLCSTDFSFSDIVAYRMEKDGNIEYNYEAEGREKHLLFCQLKGTRHYYHKNSHLCTLNPGDAVFLPHGAKYRSLGENTNENIDGIGVSFNLPGSDGENIYFDEKFRYFSAGEYPNIEKHFKKILYSVVNPVENVLRLKGEMYTLLDRLFSQKENREYFDEFFKDIMTAVNMLEKHPENNMKVSELAKLCHMSESSFMRKFKEYSGGIAPVKYRNNIRFMIAEEFASSHLTTNEIAEKLGFYDGAHLCKMYKKAKKRTLRTTQGLKAQDL